MKAWIDDPRHVEEGMEFYLTCMTQCDSDEVLADFMTFCWQSLEPGQPASLYWPKGVLTRVGEQLAALLAQAREERYRWAAPDFWRRYIAWADYGDAFHFDECRAFLQHTPGYLEPSFYLFSFAGDQTMHAGALRLFEKYEGNPSLRARYVTSVLHSSLHAKAAPGCPTWRT